MHGQMSQLMRLGALNECKAGERSTLGATDAAAAFRTSYMIRSK